MGWEGFSNLNDPVIIWWEGFSLSLPRNLRVEGAGSCGKFRLGEERRLGEVETGVAAAWQVGIWGHPNPRCMELQKLTWDKGKQIRLNSVAGLGYSIGIFQHCQGVWLPSGCRSSSQGLGRPLFLCWCGMDGPGCPFLCAGCPPGLAGEEDCVGAVRGAPDGHGAGRAPELPTGKDIWESARKGHH